MSDLDDLLAQADWPDRHPDPIRAVQAAVDRSRRRRTRWAGVAGVVVVLGSVVAALGLPPSGGDAETQREDVLAAPPGPVTCPPTPGRDTGSADRLIKDGAIGLTVCQYSRATPGGPLVTSASIDAEEVPRLAAELAEVRLEKAPARNCPSPAADRADLGVLASFSDGSIRRLVVETTCGPLRFVRADLEAPVPEDLAQDLGLPELANVSGDVPTPARAALDRPAISRDRAEQFTASLRVFAADPSAERLAALPLADMVVVGLGDEVRGTVTRQSLADPQTWRIQSPEAGYAEQAPGRFDVLAYLRKPLQRTTQVNPTPEFCTGATPASLDDASLITADGLDSAPRDLEATPPSCLEKYSVKLFLRDDRIVGITLALGAP